MTNQEALEEYSNSIKNLRKRYLEAGMNEEEFKKIYLQTLKNIENDRGPARNNYQRLRILKCSVLLVGIVIGLCTMYNFKTVYSTVMCNVQEYVYPGLKILRKIFIPIISLFPSLTDLYHETCLIQNPFFTVVDMDCWPCSTVTNVILLDDPKPNNQYSVPFIYKTAQQVINMDTLKNVYKRNRDTINKESPMIFTNHKYYIRPETLFEEHFNEKNFYIWKSQNIKIAKLLRQTIPRPKIVPKFGQSTERFIIIDNKQEVFQVPETECSFSFLLALSGTRDIHLLPAEECKHECKVLKVELKETYLLWYNWWYWRPAVQSSTGNQTFIAHVGSYC